MYTNTYSSPVGVLTLACNQKGLTGLWIEGQKYHGLGHAGEQIECSNLPLLSDTKKWLNLYFAGERPPVSALPLAPSGSAFRQIVWQILCDIPYGTVITYGDIAKKAAKKLGRSSMSGQAVGGAVGHNPISIIIPCHRVVGANGSLTGYAGGIRTKIALLELEGADMAGLFIPASRTAL